MYHLALPKIRPLLLLPEPREEVLNPLHRLLTPALRLRHPLDTTLRNTLPVLGQHEVTVLREGEPVENGGDEALRVGAVGLHVATDHLDIDVLKRVPAVVVGGHADGLVGELGFARKFGLGEGRHVDDGAAPGAVHVGFGAC